MSSGWVARGRGLYKHGAHKGKAYATAYTPPPPSLLYAPPHLVRHAHSSPVSAPPHASPRPYTRPFALPKTFHAPTTVSSSPSILAYAPPARSWAPPHPHYHVPASQNSVLVEVERRGQRELALAVPLDECAFLALPPFPLLLFHPLALLYRHPPPLGIPRDAW